MPTLSFYAPAPAARAIRTAAKKRGLKVSQFLLASAKAAVTGESVSSHTRTLAIGNRALAALRDSQERARSLGLDKMTPTQIRAIIKASHKARRTQA
jgi:hypothetical protein